MRNLGEEVLGIDVRVDERLRGGTGFVATTELIAAIEVVYGPIGTVGAELTMADIQRALGER